MNLERAKILNEYIVDKATEKVDTAMKAKSFDEESFRVLSKALDNLRDIEKIEKLEREEGAETATARYTEHEEIATVHHEPETPKSASEFEQLIYAISEKHQGKEGMIAITAILAEHMKDIKLFNKKMYDVVIMKLKNMLY